MLTLTTDFGTTEYVAQIKGVVHSIHPKARVVDVSHEITPQNVLQGAYVLASSVPYFPKGSVHVAVVDPGVGGDRRGLAIRCRAGWLVGPDNGLLWPAAHVLGVEQVRELVNSEMFLGRVTPTFHGRDVFAPVAAHVLRRGERAFRHVGPVIKDPIELRLDEGAAGQDGVHHGVVLHVDRFGNVITNLPGPMAEALSQGEPLTVRFDDKPPVRATRVHTYSEAGPDQVVVLVSSSGFLEVAMNESNAADHLGVAPGAAVEFRAKR